MDNVLRVERIYVLQELHSQRVEQLIYEQELAVARQAQVNYPWVWE